MAKRNPRIGTQKEIKPLYPLIHESNDSIERALAEAGQLLITVQTLLDLKQIPESKVADKLREQCGALSFALYGDK